VQTCGFLLFPWAVEKKAEIFYAKAAEKSAKGQPASPVDTQTAERPFARSNIKYPSAETSFLLMDMKTN